MENKIEFSFKGIYLRSMDSYGRLIIPSNFRKGLKIICEERLIISKLDKSLVAYTFAEWKKVNNSTLFLAKKSKIVREFRKHFIDHARECSLDTLAMLRILRKLRGMCLPA